MNDIIKKYFEYPDGRQEWCVSGKLGSVSFWVNETGKEWQGGGGERYYGGVEYHYTKESKPKYLGKGSHNKKCDQNNGQCWHDGTSLWASEYWIPIILPMGDDAIWNRLKQQYVEHLLTKTEGGK